MHPSAESNRTELQGHLALLRQSLSGDQVPPPAQPQAPHPPVPGGQTAEGLQKRTEDAQNAQRAMSRERNALERILDTARELQATTLGTMQKLEALKDQMALQKPIEYRTPSGIDDSLKADVPWLHEVLSDMNQAILAIVANQNAFATAFTGYAESVSQARAEADSRSEMALQRDLDAHFGIQWRPLFNDGTPERGIFVAWMESLPKAQADRYIDTLAKASYAEEVIPVLEHFRSAHPGIFTPAAPLSAEPPRPEEAANPGRVANLPLQDPNEITPLSEDELVNFGALMARAQTPEEKARLTQRRSAAIQIASQRMLAQP